ncbi:unannotated protein [freshwater metagenome]|jgi:hypothetical protein|uniref:Unannotated protein n=1 Tax=freshwater metagenome TaxID=449393 RepID=A0A6J7HL97_9ZZZZ
MASSAPLRDIEVGAPNRIFSVGKASVGTVPLMGMASAISCGRAPRRTACHGVDVVSAEMTR